MVEANSAYPDLGSDASSVWNSVLLSFFSHHFAGSQVVATLNVGFISQATPPLIQYIAPCVTVNIG